MTIPSDLARLALQNLALSSCAAGTQLMLLQRGRVQAFVEGAVVLGDGEPAGVALFPLEGTLQMGKFGLGKRRQVMCNPEAPSCGGICLLALGDRTPVEITGLDAGQVLVVDRADFEQAVAEDCTLSQLAWQSAAGCMGHLSALVTQLSFNTVAERVVLALLEGTEADGDLIRLTQAELAAEIGTTREVVARCLADLRADRIVRLGRGRITVLSREKLQARI